MYLSAPQIFYSRFKIFYSRFYGRLFSCSATFDCVDHNKLWKYLKEIGIPDHLTYLLRNLHVGQEATVRTGHGTTNRLVPNQEWSTSRLILSPPPLLFFNLYAKYIMQNTGLDEAQAGIKIARRNISNLRYADGTTLWQKAKRN